MKKYNVVSLFDGMSCGRIAIQKAGKKVGVYYASEIDNPAIKVCLNNYPYTVQLGDVLSWRSWNIDWKSIDILLGGSPCQGFSNAGKQLAFDDPRSKLFFTFVDVWKHLKKENPDAKFLLENVKMKKEWEDIITGYMGVSPIHINSSKVSAQNRKRVYWTNIEGVTQPEDRGILLKDILDDLPDCPVGIKVREKSCCLRVGGRNSPFGSKQIWDSPFQRITKTGKVKPGVDKAACLTGGAHSGGNHSDMDIIHTPYVTRRYSVEECEKLQTVPVGFTAGVSNSQRYKMLGNGWTVDVIVYILKNLD